MDRGFVGRDISGHPCGRPAEGFWQGHPAGKPGDPFLHEVHRVQKIITALTHTDRRCRRLIGLSCCPNSCGKKLVAILWITTASELERCTINTAISIDIPRNLIIQLDMIAKETENTRTFIIQKVLESYVEDYSDLQIALDRLHDEGDEIISAQEMKASLGL